MGKRKMEHIYEVGQVVNNTLRIVEQIRIKSSNRTYRGYIVESTVYPTAPRYEIRELSLKNGSGCSYSSSRRVFEGNSLYSIVEIRNNIIDIEDSKKTAKNSNVKKLFKCENRDCNCTKNISPNTLLRHGFSCPICSRGTSYPELFFNSYNIVMGLDFIPQQVFEDFKGYRFDFVDYKNRIIVETHGLQHYEEGNGFLNHKRTVASDKRKRKYCKDNNWTLIELDCRESDFEFIRKNIFNEPLLKNIEDKDIKDMVKIINKNKRHPIREIIEAYTVKKDSSKTIGKKFNISPKDVRELLESNGVDVRKRGEIPTEKRTKRRKNIPSKEISKLYVEGWGLVSLSKKYKVDTRRIKECLLDNNIEIRTVGSNQHTKK